VHRPCGVGRTYIHDVTTLQVIAGGKAPHNDPPAVENLAADSLFERSIEWISGNANRERRTGVWENLAWPLDKLRKIIEEGCLDLIFHRTSLGRRRRHIHHDASGA